MNKHKNIQYLPDGVTFQSKDLAQCHMIYAPLCGPDESGIKSAITPLLSGDIKIDKNHYLTKPASREDLRLALREFFVKTSQGIVSFSRHDGNAQVKVGQLWHELTCTFKKQGIELTALNFVPTTHETVELMKVTVKNISKKSITITPTAAIPIFARSLANKHDHEHVTALLHRIEQLPEGVLVEPTMAFNEEGHKELHQVYFVFGQEGKGKAHVGSFPTADSFYGDEGSLIHPVAVLQNKKPVKCNDSTKQGKEAVGALRFSSITLKPNASNEYIITLGIASDKKSARTMFSLFNSVKKFDHALSLNKIFWANKVGTLDFKTGDPSFNAWMRWVTLQPILRRIFGCSFLPDHDYGKGGKGWRDIWQDLLSLILIEPQEVREHLINNCAGIRIDGTNATIIGLKPGEFLADRNAITRVWMDHGCWPLMTLSLYIQQTGDFSILLEKQSYFRDPQLSRTFEKDIAWLSSYGNKLVDHQGQIYKGTLVEHVLVEHLTQFFNVGAHNVIRLESADWNDGLDMAFARGESVAFSSFYAGNFFTLASLLEDLARTSQLTTIKIAKELLILLDSLSEKVDYSNIKAKQITLFSHYCKVVQPAVSGIKVEVTIADIAKDLRSKGQWLFNHIRRQEKILVDYQGKAYQWFNGYYDNCSRRVEGLSDDKKSVRMTLTGQVFALMSGLADQSEAENIIKSVNRFLKDKTLGGFRLNTDFGMRHYLDLGRAFGFAYGTKENGAFFSHMIVMYAYALYQQGFYREGYTVLQSIYRMASDTSRSKIYPGIPEYFDSEGRGMYHYLTGSASWFVLTHLTQVFGVRGQGGDLILAPHLVKEEFDHNKIASVTCQFADHPITVEYFNPKKHDAGVYSIKEITVNAVPIEFTRLEKNKIRIKRSLINRPMLIKVLLG